MVVVAAAAMSAPRSHCHGVPTSDVLETGMVDRCGALARLAPSLRVAAVALFAVAVVMLQGLQAQSVALVMAGGVVVAARVPWPVIRHRLLALEGFMILVLILLPFSVPGPVLLSFWGVEASSTGLARALSIILKANAVMLAMTGLLATMDVVAFGHALGRLGAPDRLVTLFLFTVRYVDVLHREYARLRLSMRARGFRPRASLHCWRSLGWLFGMLLVGSVERSERVHAAMRLRGFRGTFPQAEAVPLAKLDWVFALGHGLVLAALLMWDRM